MSNNTMPERLARYAAVYTLVCVTVLAGCSATTPTRTEGPAEGIGKKWIFGVARAENACHANARVFAFYPDKKNSPDDLELGFLEYSSTNGGFVVGGMVCDKAKKVDNHAWSCTVEIEGKTEILTVGRIPSNFCRNLRDAHTNDGKTGSNNPVMDADECKQSFGARENCVCYHIEHVDSDKPPAEVCAKGQLAPQMLLPPGNGSGSGGHN